MFNYIVTIHNKEELLDRVLSGIAGCAGHDARVIAVLDGCTDGSEAIARRFAATSVLDTCIVQAPDVHEIRSINLGLRQAKPGYCVLLQDDVVLCEPRLEEMIRGLCEEYRRKLGYISFRLAADVGPCPLYRRVWLALKVGRQALMPMIDQFNYLAGPGEMLDVPRVGYGRFRQRMIGIKSPVCLTPELRECVPALDEAFAPYCYDDTDMSLEALKCGLINGLYPIRFVSQPEWGGTRSDPDFSSKIGAATRLRNRILIWRKHGAFVQTHTKLVKANRQRDVDT